MEIIILALIAGSVIYAVMGLICFVNRDKLMVAARLDEFVQETDNMYLPPELELSLRDRVLKPIMKYFTGFSSKVIPKDKKEAYERKLMAAGYPLGLTAESFVLFKYAVLVVTTILGIIVADPLMLTVFILFGLMFPSWLLKSSERKRKEAILKSLPDILDLISVSVEAGLGFDGALQKVTEKYKGPLTDEFGKALQELNMGKMRREALRDMAKRVDVDDVTTFLSSIIQADQLGVSITNVLRLQSKQVRANRRMRAEEKSQKAPIKILIPLLLCIFPTILIVLMGPAMIQLMENL